MGNEESGEGIGGFGEEMKKGGGDTKIKKNDDRSFDFTGLRALVVDDVKSNRMLVGRVLSKLGFTVELADDGDTALLAVDKNSPDIIFMDNTMVRMSGITATGVLRKQRGATIPILGVTGNSLEDDCKSFIAAGANAVYVKPVTPKVLNEACIEFLGTSAREK